MRFIFLHMIYCNLYEYMQFILRIYPNSWIEDILSSFESKSLNFAGIIPSNPLLNSFKSWSSSNIRSIKFIGFLWFLLSLASFCEFPLVFYEIINILYYIIRSFICFILSIFKRFFNELVFIFWAVNNQAFLVL